jgi:hypothetical protein
VRPFLEEVKNMNNLLDEIGIVPEQMLAAERVPA